MSDEYESYYTEWCKSALSFTLSLKLWLNTFISNSPPVVLSRHPNPRRKKGKLDSPRARSAQSVWEPGQRSSHHSETTWRTDWGEALQDQVPLPRKTFIISTTFNRFLIYKEDCLIHFTNFFNHSCEGRYFLLKCLPVMARNFFRS